MKRRRSIPETKSPDALFRCRELVVGHRGHALLPPIELTVDRGEVVLVVGRNGAGKSTWLKTVLGLIPPVSGHSFLARPELRVAYVPQSAALDELLPVRAQTVVSWGRLRGWSFLRPWRSAHDRDICRQSIEHAHAKDFICESFSELSGGQRQRVLFARLLASEADLVFADEPTASMDVAAERAAYDQLAHLARKHGVGVVIVTHTLSMAERVADKVLFVDRGNQEDQGVAVFGRPQEVCNHPLYQRHFGRSEGEA